MEYVLRVVIVAVALLAAATFLGAVALIPAYVKVTTDMREITSLRDQEVEGQDVTAFKAAEAELTETAHIVSVLKGTLQGIPATDIIAAVFSVLPEGVSVQGMSFERGTGIFMIEGTATTRDALVSYRRALESIEDIRDVTSPISNLAKNANLPFQLSFRVLSATTTMAHE